MYAESYIEDMSTGERMWVSEAQGMYMLKFWVKRSVLEARLGKRSETELVRPTVHNKALFG